MIQQSPTERADAHVPITPEVIRYVQRYQGTCRDCADEAGHCPRNGIACGDSEKAIRFVLEAINYGVSHGYLALSQAAQPAEADGVERVCAQCKGAIGDLPDGRDPEEFCDTCYEDAVASLATPKAPTSTAAEEGPPCENCGDPVRVGHVVLPYDDVGELHADCANPYSLTVEPVADGPKPCVLVGSPMIHVPLSALATPPAPNDDLRAALVHRFAVRMKAACDRTRAGKDHVKVATADWHALMTLADNAAALKENRRG